MGNIDWFAAADAPDALKDGRDVLAWVGCPVIARWVAERGKWRDEGDGKFILPTHFAEINAPEGVTR